MKRAAVWVLVSLVAASAGVEIAHAQGTDLQKAYRREVAFLEAEKSSLQKRIAEQKTEAQQKVAAAKSEIDRLQGSIMRSTVDGERLSEMLMTADRAVESVEEGGEIVNKTIEQAGELLEKYDRVLPEGPAAVAAAPTEPSAEGAVEEVSKAQAAKRLELAMLAAVELIATLDDVRTEQGTYFALDGKQIDGPIVRIGNVASFGAAEGATGTLSPAGAGRLKLWPEPAAASVAAALAQGQAPDRLRVFLYESLDNSVEHKRERTTFEVIQLGGAIGWVIVGLGCIGLLLIIVRIFLLARSAANTDKLVSAIAPLVTRGAIEEAIEVCRRSKSSAGRVLRATLQNLKREREHLEDIVSESILHENTHLERFGSTLLVIAAVAPLLGLLGTVTGMIATFDVITDYGTGNPKLLSGGISEALVTTQLGLVVAIPVLLLGNLLAGWAESIKDDMDKGALRLVNVSTGIEVSNAKSETSEDKVTGGGRPQESLA